MCYVQAEVLFPQHANRGLHIGNLPSPILLLRSGAKRWKLYKPLGGFQLPSQSSPNLDVEGLGEPILDTVLRVRYMCKRAHP